MRKLWLVVLGGCLWAAPVDDARKILFDAANGKESDQRRETALALSLISAKDPAGMFLESLLKDKDFLVRVAAVDTLGELNDKSRLPLLKAALADEVPEVAFAAAKALFSMKDPAGTEALEAVFAGERKAKSGFVKKEIMTNMRRLKTPRSAFLFAVERGIGFVPLPGVGEGYNALMGMLNDAEFSSRAVTLMMVCKERSSACDSMLDSSFDDEDWTVRAASIHVVATKGLVARKPKVAALMTDKKEKVRLRAAAGFLRMESLKPVPAPAGLRKR